MESSLRSEMLVDSYFGKGLSDELADLDGLPG